MKHKVSAVLAAGAATAAAAIALGSPPSAVAIPSAPGAPPRGPCALRGISDDVAESTDTPAGFSRSSGTVEALTLFIDFPDARATMSPAPASPSSSRPRRTTSAPARTAG